MPRWNFQIFLSWGVFCVLEWKCYLWLTWALAMASPVVTFQPGLLMLPQALSPLSVDTLHICAHCIYCSLSVTHSWAGAFRPCPCKAKIFAVRPFVRCSSPGLFSVKESEHSLQRRHLPHNSTHFLTIPQHPTPARTPVDHRISSLCQCCGCWYCFCQAVAQVEKTGSWGWKAFCAVCPSSVQ